MFCVDEVIIFDDGVQDTSGNSNQQWQDQGRKSTSANDLLALILSYLETPPHMRRKLFPMNPDLQKAGLLPSLDMPHHLRRDEWCQYREGVTIKSNGGKTSVDVGTEIPVEIPLDIPPNTRVTIKFPDAKPGGDISKIQAVAPSAPREDDGWYWGYDVRQAKSLSSVLTECPWGGGYDVSIGTSERGRPSQDMLRLWSDMQRDHPDGSIQSRGKDIDKIKALLNYSHLLLVFGAHQGLEVAARNDTELKQMGVDQPEKLFDWWVNLCPGQGSRTIRTEEAIWLGLTTFRSMVESRGKSS